VVLPRNWVVQPSSLSVWRRMWARVPRDIYSKPSECTVCTVLHESGRSCHEDGMISLHASGYIVFGASTVTVNLLTSTHIVRYKATPCTDTAPGVQKCVQ